MITPFFILRPGQVHRLELTADSPGFLMEFDLSLYQPKNTITDQRWKKASSKNYCEVEAARFMKLHSILDNVFNEFATKQDGYEEALKANLDLFFIEYVRQSRNPKIVARTENGRCSFFFPTQIIQSKSLYTYVNDIGRLVYDKIFFTG